MIELLVAILVIGVLITMIVAIGSRAIDQQRVALTRSVLANATLAADVFAAQDPLRSIYNRRDKATFGPYPPYSLANAPSGTILIPGSVAEALEPSYVLGQKDTLGDRLARDLSGDPGVSVNQWVDLASDANDDNRAFYCYLRSFAAGALDSFGDDVLKPLAKDRNEYVNPNGDGTVPGASMPALFSALGIHDGWGVPIDYFLMIKLEIGIDDSGSTPQVVYKVADRRPVFRSRGIAREVYDLEVADNTRPRNGSKWIYSEELPRPYAGVGNKCTGLLPASGGLTSEQNQQLIEGWARAVPHLDDCEAVANGLSYVP